MLLQRRVLFEGNFAGALLQSFLVLRTTCAAAVGHWSGGGAGGSDCAVAAAARSSSSGQQSMAQSRRAATIGGRGRAKRWRVTDAPGRR
eukprot:SAG31_NODE_378_length_16503_cov_28.830041_8_plen_89_part_00